VGRTFIEPRQSIRHFGVKVKLNPVRSVIEGRGIVHRRLHSPRHDEPQDRGHGRHAGPRRSTSGSHRPRTTGPCHYGIDTPKREELIASTHSIAEIAKFVGADTRGYLSVMSSGFRSR
jgi:amidophosphoribosyltransferase